MQWVFFVSYSTNSFRLRDSDPAVCSSQGVCIGPDVCSCNAGYLGTYCQYSYSDPNVFLLSWNWNYWGSFDAVQTLNMDQTMGVAGVSYQHSIQFIPTPNRNNTVTWSLKGGWKTMDLVLGINVGMN